MLTLAAIEVDLKTLRGRKRAGDKKDMDRLLQALERVKAVPEASIDCHLLDDDDPLHGDDSFWPRVFLSPRGTVCVRARDPQEATRCLQVILSALEVLRDHAGWQSSSVADGTPHAISIRTDKEALERLATKVAYGLACLHPGLGLDAEDRFPGIRAYVLDGAGDPPATLITDLEAAFTGGSTVIAACHVALIEEFGSRVRAFVSLSGMSFHVDLGPGPGSIVAVGAKSRRDGTDTRFLSETEVDAVSRVFRAQLQAASEKKTDRATPDSGSRSAGSS